RDLLDVFDAAYANIADILEPVSVTKSEIRLKRDEDFHVAIKLKSILYWVAAAHGLNELDEKALADAWSLMVEGEAPPALDSTSADHALS
ncbi:hypothetical protein, partial [Klebsiella pneumoniae]|uniref:hypothetical protein n=1 Tax=Klebsiella pneumoniae TaxID=573 RepID=UPI0013D39103